MKSRNVLPGLIPSITMFCLFTALFIQGCSNSKQTQGSSGGTTGGGTSTTTIEPVDSFLIPEEGKAKTIIEKSGVKGGLIVHINCGNGVLTEEFKTNDSYLVQGLDASVANVQIARQHILSKEQYGSVSVSQLAGTQLPFIDNLVNLIVSENLGGISLTEVMRVLAPNGVAIIKGAAIWYKLLP